MLCLGGISDQPVEAWKLGEFYLKDVVPVENIPRIRYTGHARRDSTIHDCITQ